jgi:hypothetical protein
MADDLNALLQANRSSSVLEGIANPPQFNPLAAQNSAVQAASAMYGIREKQAQQAWGDILQQATDANGNVDYQKAQRLAAGTPAASMGMMSALKDTSALRGSQINNTAGHMLLLGTAALTVAKDPSDASLHAAFDNLAANGMPQESVEKERARWAAMSPAERQQQAFRVGLTNLSGLQRVLGVTTQTNLGGVEGATTLLQPSPGNPAGALVQGPGTIDRTVDPGSVTGFTAVPANEQDVKDGKAAAVGQTIYVPQADMIKRGGYGGILPPSVQRGGGAPGAPGVVTRDGQPASPANPPRLLRVPGAAPTPAAPGATPGASPAAPAPTGNTGFGAAIGTPGALPVPPVPPAVPPPVPGAGPRSALEGGVPVASVNALAPGLGAASAPSPAVAGDVNAMLAGMEQARAAPRGGPQVAGASFTLGGPGYEEKATSEASAARLAADRLAAADYHATQFPYVQALKEYGAGMKTGAGSDFWTSLGSYVRTPFAKIGVEVGSLNDAVQRAESLKKWLANIQTSNPIAGRSDAMLAQTLHGSASTSINDLSGEDMVKAGFALNRMKIAGSKAWDVMTPQEQAQHGNYLKWLGKYSSDLDPRAFAIDMYNPNQIKNLREQLKTGGEANVLRFERSLKMARDLNLVGTGTQAMP